MDVLPADADFPYTSARQKDFLSWQSEYETFMLISIYNLYFFLAWDLLCIDVYGFKAFCKYFLEKYPGYFISPLRISGSSVESLFSQYKHNAGGKLDSVIMSQLDVHILYNSVHQTTTVELAIVTKY